MGKLPFTYYAPQNCKSKNNTLINPPGNIRFGMKPKGTGKYDKNGNNKTLVIVEKANGKSQFMLRLERLH